VALVPNADGTGEPLAGWHARRRSAIHACREDAAPHCGRWPRPVLLTSFVTFELPLKARGFTLSAAWHQRNQADPGHVWLREQFSAGPKV